MTDAYLLCNYLSPRGLLGGKLPLSRDRAEQAMLAIASGVDAVTAAESIVAIATSNMLAKVLPFLARAGVGPADLTLMIFGGAGGVHGPLLAEELGIRRIVVPRLSSVFCAFGGLAADLVHDGVRSVTGAHPNEDALLRIFDELSQSGREWVQRQAAGGKLEGIDELYLAEMRYSAQSFTIPVNLTDPVRNGSGLNGFYDAFHEEHKALFGFSNPGTPVAFNELMVRTSGHQAKPNARSSTRQQTDKIAPTSCRDLRLQGRWWPACAVFDRATLARGWSDIGPAVIEHDLSTVLVPPDFRAAISALGDIVMTKES
ncbi:N-methylhydantoinase A/oxoprolinase/acetone carboxylase beta subunit [Bradyrhizobium sp. GM22.5]